MSRQSKGNHTRGSGAAACSGPGAGQSRKAFRPEVQPGRWLSLIVCLFLAGVVWAVFGQTLHYGFVYDDPLYVTENMQVRRGLTWAGAVWSLRSSVASNWHPLTMLTHMLDCQLYGLNPGGHHLTNVLLHASTAILLFLVLRDMTGAFWRAAFVAAVFAIHPLRVESVAWVSERKDVLSGLFFMLTLWAYARYAENGDVRNAERGARSVESGNEKGGTRKQGIWYGLALLLFAMGLMAKPMLVTVPFILLLLDYWPLGRLGPAATVLDYRRLGLEKIPFVLLAAGDCAATMLAQRNAISSVQDLSFFARLGNAGVAYADYLWQMVYPVGLAAFYPHSGNQLSVGAVGWSALVLSLISAGVVAGRQKHPYLLAGWLWYLGMVLPVIGLIQVGSQARADRYTYLPQIGLYIMAAWGAAELCGCWRWRRSVLGFGAGAILAGLLTGAYVQTGYWKDNVSLWTHTLACTSENSTACNNLGIALAGEGKLEAAVRQYERALELNPDDAEARNNLGTALLKNNQSDKAIIQYQEAIHLKPDNAEAHNNLGYALAAQGKWEEAMQQYEQALDLKPGYIDARFNFGNALARQGKWEGAIREYERLLQLNPDYADAHNNLGFALAIQGKLEAAMRQYERAIELNPDSIEAHNNLGYALAAQGKWEDARRQYERAIELNPDYAEAHNNLGIALAAQGKRDEAISQYQEAIRLKPDYAEARNNLTLVQGMKNAPVVR